MSTYATKFLPYQERYIDHTSGIPRQGINLLFYTEYQMDPDLKAVLVAALRSGDYKQGAGCLRQLRNGTTRHCCLGVLGEVMLKYDDLHLDDHARMRITEDLEGPMPTVGFRVAAGNRTKETGDWMFFLASDHYGNMVGHTANALNDSGEFTFDMIADLVDYFW